MAGLTGVKENDLSGREKRKADRLPLKMSAVVISVVSIVCWALVILLGIALWSGVG
jgi:hypothetical protein